jgi:hypothetical protein
MKSMNRKGQTMAKKMTRVKQVESVEDKKRRELLRAQVEKEFPPKRRAAKPSVGIARQIRDARMAQGLTWYAVAKKAGIPNSGTVRAIEEGQDAKLSSVEAVAAVLGLKLSAIDATL